MAYSHVSVKTLLPCDLSGIMYRDHIGCVVMIFGVGLLWGAIVLEVIHATHGKVVAYHTTVNLWLSAAL